MDKLKRLNGWTVEWLNGQGEARVYRRHGIGSLERIGVNYHCPKCNGILYDRRLKACGFCGAAIPKEFLFTPAQLENLRQDAEKSEKRIRELRAEEKARRDREISDENSWLRD